MHYVSTAQAVRFMDTFPGFEYVRDDYVADMIFGDLAYSLDAPICMPCGSARGIGLVNGYKETYDISFTIVRAN